jgi:UDP-glucose 4-epimerase
MLKHFNPNPVRPVRIVVLGAGGFIGGAIAQRLRAARCEVLALSRGDLDLLQPQATKTLAELLRGEDAFVIVSARAPAKSDEQLIENLHMMIPVITALRQSPVRHVVYISSDAVYADSDNPLTEASCAQPSSLHGIMHLAREIMLMGAFTGSLCFLRPTLVYGAQDPHNGYGPNRFLRDAIAGRPIVLFGNGEERRDHVLVDDVAEIVVRILMHRSTGILNLATGSAVSFREIAELVASRFNPRSSIITSPRQGPMPHRGFRAFDIQACKEAFPDFRFTPLRDGIALACSEELSA